MSAFSFSTGRNLPPHLEIKSNEPLRPHRTVSQSTSRIFSTDDARRLARRRLPRLVFDFVEGAAGREIGSSRNTKQFDNVLLQPRVMKDVEDRDLSTHFMGDTYGVPFGIAPMGMCNLVCPSADRSLADAAVNLNLPVCLSSAASSSLEDMAVWAGKRAWFQLYFGQSQDASMAMVARAQRAGYETLVLTVDVPQVSRRLRDLRNGFQMPFRMTSRAIWDFATHPRWSLSTLAAGAPSPQNYASDAGSTKFDRNASRAGANWAFLQKLRDKWRGKLIVKGVTSAHDASRIKSLGVDAIYVSNHGARQLDSVPPALRLLPLIRAAVGPNYPVLFDSGVRNGEDVVKALASGADFVMIGRPALFALGAKGANGLNALLKSFKEDIDVVMAQLGVTSIDDIQPHVLFEPTPKATQEGRYDPEPETSAGLHLPAKNRG